MGRDLAVDVTLLDQIGKDAPHIRIRLRQHEGLPGRFLPVEDGGVCLPLLTVQQQADRLRIAEIVKPLDEADRPAALAAGVVEPLAAAHSHAVVPRQALVAPRGEELFSLLAEKGLQIDACGTFLLRFGEIDKFAHGMNTSIRSGAR